MFENRDAPPARRTLQKEIYGFLFAETPFVCFSSLFQARASKLLEPPPSVEETERAQRRLKRIAGKSEVVAFAVLKAICNGWITGRRLQKGSGVVDFVRAQGETISDTSRGVQLLRIFIKEKVGVGAARLFTTSPARAFLMFENCPEE